MAKDTMKAVVFKGPHKVEIEDRPIPKIQDPTDIIVKVDKVRVPLLSTVLANVLADRAVRQVRIST